MKVGLTGTFEVSEFCLLDLGLRRDRLGEEATNLILHHCYLTPQRRQELNWLIESVEVFAITVLVRVCKVKSKTAYFNLD